MSTLCFSRISVGAFVLAAGLTMTACEVERPKGFTPTKREVTQGNSDLFPDDGGSEPVAGTNGAIDDPDFPVEEPDGGMAIPVDSPLAKVQGYYWLRTDIEFTYKQTTQGVTLEVFNRASHMALTRLVADGTVLKAVERNCHIFYQHECKRSCSSFSTTVAAGAATLYRALDLPRVYSLTNNNSMFSTDTASLLLGWTGPADPLPSSLSDPSVWNASNDATSKGFYINVKTGGLPSSPFSPSSLDCYYNTVERFTSAYSGPLKNGSLDGVNATLNTTGSKADTLDTQGGGLCTPGTNNAPISRTTVRFASVPGGASFWTCPSLADFKAKLADP